jgi:N-acetylglucosaminyldiphosphoundecaprenol N-acetyl-beta-D-mannosaminyltransferase
MSNLKNLYYLGTRIDYEINSSNFEDSFLRILKKGNSKIYTINPEFIVDSYFNADFKKELNSSDLNVIDGVGLLYGIKKHFKSVIDHEIYNELKTLTGVDLVNKVLEIADKKKLSLFLLGGSQEIDISNKAIEKIRNKYPDIVIVGGSSRFSFEKHDDEDTLAYIKNCMKELSLNEIDLIFVGYGHVKQENWIGRNSTKIPARVSIGVGGTLDYLSGSVKRAPKFFRNLGLEWLYRFLTQPKRIFRILKATVIFSYLSNTLLSKNFSKN